MTMNLAFNHVPIQLGKVPRRHASTLFALVMSSTMSGLMSALLTAVHTGVDAGFSGRWLAAWPISFGIAFPLVLLLAPQVRKLVDRVTE